MTSSMSFMALIDVTSQEGWRRQDAKTGHPYLVRTVATVESDRVSFTPEDICAELLEPGGDPPWDVNIITPNHSIPTTRGMDLLGALIGKNVDDLGRTNQAIQDGLQYDLDVVRAELQLIREAVENLLDSPHAPSERAIVAAVWPRQDAINERAYLVADLRKANQS